MANRRVAVWVAIIIIGLAAVLAWSAGQDDEPAPRSTAGDVFRSPGEVTVRVEGAGDASNVTIGVDGSITQGTDLDLPLERTVEVDAGGFVSVSAQRSSGNTGPVACRIMADGVVVDEAESSGPYVVVSCSGRIPG